MNRKKESNNIRLRTIPIYPRRYQKKQKNRWMRVRSAQLYNTKLMKAKKSVKKKRRFSKSARPGCRGSRKTPRRRNSFLSPAMRKTMIEMGRRHHDMIRRKSLPLRSSDERVKFRRRRISTAPQGKKRHSASLLEFRVENDLKKLRKNEKDIGCKEFVTVEFLRILNYSFSELGDLDGRLCGVLTPLLNFFKEFVPFYTNSDLLERFIKQNTRMKTLEKKHDEVVSENMKLKRHRDFLEKRVSTLESNCEDYKSRWQKDSLMTDDSRKTVMDQLWKIEDEVGVHDDQLATALKKVSNSNSKNTTPTPLPQKQSSELEVELEEERQPPQLFRMESELYLLNLKRERILQDLQIAKRGECNDDDNLHLQKQMGMGESNKKKEGGPKKVDRVDKEQVQLSREKQFLHERILCQLKKKGRCEQRLVSIHENSKDVESKSNSRLNYVSNRNWEGQDEFSYSYEEDGMGSEMVFADEVDPMLAFEIMGENAKLGKK